MDSYKNSYGQYEDNKNLRLDLKGKEEEYHSCQFCIEDDGEVVTLTNRDKTTTIKIKKKDFEVIGYPEFLPGDKVERVDGSRTGIVYDVWWIEHGDGDDDYFAYLLDYPERRSTRWNKAEELKKSCKIDYIKLSKTISYILRHHPEEYGLLLDNDGFVDINMLLNSINSKKEFDNIITIEDINHILSTSEKKRWEIVDNKIRAYYGHSIKQEIRHEVKNPPDILYHGTTHDAVDTILKNGLLPMERQFVHLSEDIETAITVGKRRDANPIVLKIDSKKAHNDGVIFMCENNIWLAKYIDKKYISKY